MGANSLVGEREVAAAWRFSVARRVGMLLLSLEVRTWAMREVAKAKEVGVFVALKTSPLDATNCDEIIEFLEEKTSNDLHNRA